MRCGLTFLIGLILLASPALLIAQQSPPATDDDVAFVERHLVAARDQMMPLSAPSVVAAYRSSFDKYADGAETAFSIIRTYQYREAQLAPPRVIPPATIMSYVATLIEPLGSVRSQLLSLRLADREAPLDTLLMRMGVRRTKIEESKCPAIRRRVDLLSGMQIVLPRQQRLTSHDMGHEIVVSGPGAYISGSFTDPDVSLVGWARGTLDALRQCANR